MQQAYRTIRVTAEAQTVRIALASAPDALMLRELSAACAAFDARSSSEVKAVILDIGSLADASAQDGQAAPEAIAQAAAAVQAVAPPTLAIARGALSAGATALALTADLLLMADTASLSVPLDGTGGYETINAREAAQKKLVTLLASPHALSDELDRVLNRLRDKSALALRLAKSSINLAARIQQAVEAQRRIETSTSRLAALQEVNDFYLEHVAQTADAVEGLHAFLEKRQPQWKNQ